MAKRIQGKRKNRNFKKYTPTGQKLTDQQKTAVQMLYNGDRVCDVAAALGVHRTTIWRWQNRRAFRKEWQRIDHNWKRRYKRRHEKLIEEQRATQERLIMAYEERVQKAAGNIKEKPTKAFDNAWNAYINALLGGVSLSAVLDWAFFDKPIKLKRQRLVTPVQPVRGKTGGTGGKEG